MNLLKDFLWVGMGGLLGSVGRYGVTLLFIKTLADRSFFATALVNLVGSLLIGMLIGQASKSSQVPSLFLVTGICGGFTTFSAFSIDAIKLLKEGLYFSFFGYVTLSVIGGLICCAIGYLATSKS